MAPPSGPPPDMMPPPGAPPGDAGEQLAKPGDFTEATGEKNESTLATLDSVGFGKDRMDMLQMIKIPTEDLAESRPVPKQVKCLEDGTDIFKMFDVDMNRFDPKAVKKGFHKLSVFVHPDKIGR